MSRYLVAANNLSDLTNVATARTNLALGNAALLNTNVANGVPKLDSSGNLSASTALATGTSTAQTLGAVTTGVSLPMLFGAAGDGVTHDNAAFTALNTYTSGLGLNNNTFYEINLRGKSFATSVPWTLPSNVVVKNGNFTALAGSSLSDTTGVLNCMRYNIHLVDLFVDCNRIPGVKAVYNTGTANINFTRIAARHWVGTCNFIGSISGNTLSVASVLNSGAIAIGAGLGGPGIPLGTTIVSGSGLTWTISTSLPNPLPSRLLSTNMGGGICQNGGKANLYDCRTSQWSSGDTEFSTTSAWTGFGISAYGSADWDVISGVSAFGIAPIYIDSTSHHIRFIRHHPYQGNSATGVQTNPVNVWYRGFNCLFVGLYLDTGLFLIDGDAATNSNTVNVQIVDTQPLYNSADVTLSSWISLTTSGTNTSINNLIVTGGSWSGGIPIFVFSATGSGSWNLTAVQITALESLINGANITGQVANVYPGFNGNGVATLQGFLIGVNTQTGAYTIVLADSGNIVKLTGSSAGTVTLPLFVTSTPLETTVIVSGSGTYTMTAVVGAFLNGKNGGSITLQRYLPYTVSTPDGTNYAVFGVGAVVPGTPSVQTLTGSPWPFTAPNYGCVVSTGGTGSAVFKRPGTANVTMPSLDFILPVSPNDIVTYTYTAAPTVTFIPT